MSPQRIVFGQDRTKEEHMSTPDTSRVTLWLTIARACAVAVLLNVAVLFVTAGMLVQEGSLEEVHGGAAIALHVFTGGLALALLALAAQRRHGWWAASSAVVLFVYTFLQAYLGKGRTLYLHIPGAFLVIIVSVWLAAWLFLRQHPDAKLR
jgi:hypothetical protein